eukprot:jgi/Botrbrau1/2084/Bobra.0047s0045.1
MEVCDASAVSPAQLYAGGNGNMAHWCGVTQCSSRAPQMQYSSGMEEEQKPFTTQQALPIHQGSCQQFDAITATAATPPASGRGKEDSLPLGDAMEGVQTESEDESFSGEEEDMEETIQEDEEVEDEEEVDECMDEECDMGAASRDRRERYGTFQDCEAVKSHYRGVCKDKKKGKWRVQIKVANLGKSGVSVGYFDNEAEGARAYDRAAIALLGREKATQLNFDVEDYDLTEIPDLRGKTREEVKTALKKDRTRGPRRRTNSRTRTSRYVGVGKSNRKNQWQARLIIDKKVTHLGYYPKEEEAARIYDRVSLILFEENGTLNFPEEKEARRLEARQSDDKRPPLLPTSTRAEVQAHLGVTTMNKSSDFRGVSRKKHKWEAKVMVNRRWVYRELFSDERAAAHAYDKAVKKWKPDSYHNYINFPDEPGTSPAPTSKNGRQVPISKGQHSKTGASSRTPTPLSQKKSARLSSLEHPTPPPSHNYSPSRHFHSAARIGTKDVLSGNASRASREFFPQNLRTIQPPPYRGQTAAREADQQRDTKVPAEHSPKRNPPELLPMDSLDREGSEAHEVPEAVRRQQLLPGGSYGRPSTCKSTFSTSISYGRSVQPLPSLQCGALL